MLYLFEKFVDRFQSKLFEKIIITNNLTFKKSDARNLMQD